MSNDPRRQSIALLVVATTAVVLTAVVPWAGALEPLDEVAPVTTILDTVVDEAEETVTSTTSSSTTTSSTTTTTSSTTTTTEAPTTTTTTEAQPVAVSGGARAAAPAPARPPVATPDRTAERAPVPAAAPVEVDEPEAADTVPLPVGNPWGPIDLDGGADVSPPARILVGGPRSTVEVVEMLDGVGAPPSLVAKVLAPFPVAGAATYSDDWAAPRHGGRRHQGTDIFAQRGTPVIAAADGVVGNMTTTAVLGGTALRVTAANGTYFYYAHLDRFAPGLANGDEVSAGDVVGFVGNTGNARTTPPHLHFQVHPRGGAPVPPVPYLDRWLDEARTAAAAVAGAPAVDALVRPGVQLALAPPPAPPVVDVPLARAGGPATALTSSQGGTPPVDPMPLAILLLPAAWLARHGVRELRAWRSAR